jgi:hypothetical protein
MVYDNLEERIVEDMTVYISIASMVAAIVFGAIAVRQTGKSNDYQKQALAQAATIEQIKKFDEPTAFAMFSQARKHEHRVWELLGHLKKLREENPGIDTADFHFWIGKAHGEADDIVDNMIRVYMLSGAVITDEKVASWVNDGLIPEHYKPRILGHIR